MGGGGRENEERVVGEKMKRDERYKRVDGEGK
jgi:hypothetical protein